MCSHDSSYALVWTGRETSNRPQFIPATVKTFQRLGMHRSRATLTYRVV